MERDNSVESAIASIIEILDRDPYADLEKLLERFPEQASEIRARVERLRCAGLLHARSDSNLTEIRARFEQPGEPSTTPGDSGPMLPSQVLGSRYRITAEIGRGGMGRVFRALDLDMEREVALKIIELPPQARERDSRRASLLERFIREARLTANLEHPSIVPLHDVGVDRTGQLYYTMKLIQGRSLDSLFRLWHQEDGGPVHLDELLRILLRASEAVALAHSKGVIHRDLKPGNIMLGDFGEVYVLDWGLARAVDARDEQEKGPPAGLVAGRESPTLMGEVLGTPLYMSPEQREDPKSVDRRADVYGLGAIMHHGLFGQAPQATATGSTVFDRKTLSVSPEVLAICEKALQFAPSRRYADASALADDLRAALEGRVVRAHRTGPWVEFRKWASRNRRAASLAGIALALAMGASGVFIWLKREIDRNALDARRLGDLLVLEELEKEADLLWPVTPELIPRYENWIDRASVLVGRLPEHRAGLQAMSDRADTSSVWFARQMETLVRTLDEFRGGMLSSGSTLPGRGWSIPKRLSFARDIRSGMEKEGTYERLWSQALPAIRQSYPGVEVSPQEALVPIGADPRSGLWEFSHLPTGTPATRSAAGELVLEEQSGLVFVLLPGGTFQMGAQSLDPDGPNYDPEANDEDESPVHSVTLAPFFISKYEMTQGQWLRLTGANPSEHAPGMEVDGKTVSLLHPVEHITWIDGTRCLNFVGLELPTESQWEYAARGKTLTPRWTDNDFLSLKEASNIADAAWGRLGLPGEPAPLDDGWAVHAPVSFGKANPFGLHGTIGNVMEWCKDPKAAYTMPPAPLDGDRSAHPWNGDLDSRVMRDSSYFHNGPYVRVANRLRAHASSHDQTLGVRPARRLRLP